MRKLILIAALAATAMPSAAMAETRRHHRAEVRHDQRELRQDRRELRRDQRQWRQAHRQRVAYVAPYRNWQYRPVRVGYNLRPAFYGSRYYISDYGRYNIRAPRYSYLRWIRYGNELVLVNIRNGRVLQVMPYAGW